MRISDWRSDVCSSDLALDPDINMWETAEPFVREWIRDELGPEAWFSERLIRDVRTLADLPELVRRIARHYPPEGAAPPPPPLPDIQIIRVAQTRWFVLSAQIGRASCRERVGQYV